MANKLSSFTKVNENVSIYRYDNGWMIEIGGRDKKGDYATSKILCNSEDELLNIVKHWNKMELDN